MAFQRERYYDGRSHYGWSPSQEYNNYEGDQSGFRKPRHHHKSHVAFKEGVEEVILRDSYDRHSEVRPYSEPKFCSAYQSVDQEADAFIKTQHKRIELAKLRSMGAADPTITYI